MPLALVLVLRVRMERISPVITKELAMQNGPKTVMSRRQHKPGGVIAARSMRWTSSSARPEPKDPQNAQRSYERYLALARVKPCPAM